MNPEVDQLSARSVEDLKKQGLDPMEDPVLDIYGKKSPLYAVYATHERVRIMFADAKDDAADQRKRMASLAPVRGEINGLIDGWRYGTGPGLFAAFRRAIGWSDAALKRKAERYSRRVGDALVVGFEGEVDDAQKLLQNIKQDILDERIAKARFDYLVAAFVTGLVLMLLIQFANDVWTYRGNAVDLGRGAAAGAVGAFFSIALAIRGRTILPDLQALSNRMDAILRIVIGVIAGGVVMALLKSGGVSIRLGDAQIMRSGSTDWLPVLIYGFLAGFSERLVPDLLAKASAITSSTDARTVAAEAKKDGETETAVTRAEAANDANGASEAAPLTTVPDDPTPEEAGIDSCACDIDLPDEEATGDVDLPPASGGVAPAKAA